MNAPAADPKQPGVCTSCGSAVLEESGGGLCGRCAGAGDSARTVLISEIGARSSRGSCRRCSVPVPGESTMDLCAQCLLDVPLPPTGAGDTGPLPEIPGHRFLRKLGQGAMGAVWLAEQEATRRLVAVKLCVDRDIAGEGLRRFEREVELAARMDHPHIARVFGGGEAGGAAYYVMEYVDGGNLAHHLRTRQPSMRAIVELMRDVCDGVQHAHQNGIIHRDLKPSNIMVTAEGAAKVVDFGLAKALEKDVAALDISLSGQLIGTPRYMAPEQARGAAVDTRTDVYALGVILFEALTGQHPHDTDGTWNVLLRRIAEDEPRRPRSLRRDLDSEMEMLLLRALNKAPDGRYRTAGELADELRHWLAGEPLAAGRATPWYFARKWIGRHRAAALAAAALLFLAVGAAAFYVVNIRAERDKVRASERETRRMLAESLAHNAELSAQRGLWREALAQWDSAIAGGHADPDELRLQRLTALHAEQRLADAAAEMKALAARPLSTSQRARLDVWLAEREFSHGQTDAGVAILRGIPDGILPAADAAYVRGLLAERVSEAVDAFTEALDHAPHHMLASGRICLLLMLSGRHDDAVLRASVAASLYPKDYNFPFIAVCARLFSGRKAEAEALIKTKLATAPRIYREGAELLVDFLDAGGRSIQKMRDGEEMNTAGMVMQFMPLMMRAKQMSGSQGAESIGLSAAFSTPLSRKLSGNLLEAVLKGLVAKDTKAGLAALDRAMEVWDIADLYIPKISMLREMNDEEGELRAAQEFLKRPIAFVPQELRHSVEEMAAFRELQHAQGEPLAMQRAMDAYRTAAQSGPLVPMLTVQAAVLALREGQFEFVDWLADSIPKEKPDHRLLKALVAIQKGNLRAAWTTIQSGPMGEADWVRSRVLERAAWFESELQALRQELVGAVDGRLGEFERRAGEAGTVESRDTEFFEEVMHLRTIQERLGRESESRATMDRLRLAVRQWADREAEKAGAQVRSPRAVEAFAAAWAGIGGADEAEHLLRGYLDVRGKAQSGDVRLPHVQSQLGELLLKQRRYSEAEPFLLGGFDALAKLPGTPLREVAAAGRHMVRLCVKTGRDGDAVEWRRRVTAVLKDSADLAAKSAPLRQAVENARGKPESQREELASALWNLFNFYIVEERFEEAEKHGREALALWEKIRPEDWNHFRVQAGLGRSLLLQGRVAEAEPLLVSGCEGMLRRRSEIPHALGEVLVRGINSLVELYLETDRAAPAAEWETRLAALSRPDPLRKN